MALSRILKAPTQSQMMDVVAEIIPKHSFSPESVQVMTKLIWDKFLRNPDLQLDLVQTKNQIIEYESRFDDKK